MMKKSTSTKVSLFLVFVLTTAIVSVNGNVYAQNETLSNALNVTDLPLDNSTNVTQATSPPEEELLPTTNVNSTNSTTPATTASGNATSADGLVTTDNNATGAAPRDDLAGETSGEYSQNATHDDSTVARDSQTILLEGQTLPEGSFIHLYDTTPYKIHNGHVAAKLPCSEDNSSAVNVLIGQAPNLAPAQLEFIPELSTAGELCLYHVDLESNETNPITDIAIQNNSTDDIDFPATSTVVIGINEISPLGEHSHEE
jgi:hypothetical protein